MILTNDAPINSGFAMGGLFGMFMSSVDYNPQSAYEGMNMRQQMAFTLKDMGKRSYSSAKNFSKVGALFAGIYLSIPFLSRDKNCVKGRNV